MGNTLTSFMCPNMTLFDQSIMQCNYWYNVNCASSHNHYDANLPMALSFRKINAAQLPLTAVRDLGSVALMGLDAAFNAGQSAAAPGADVTENLAFRRRAGEAAAGPREGRDSPEGQRDILVLADGTPRRPRTLDLEEQGGKEVKDKKKKAASAADGEKAGGGGPAADGEKETPAKERGKAEGGKQQESQGRRRRSAAAPPLIMRLYRFQ